ncbi:MAG: hypothetical protein JRE71_17105, partial [Deltaproteobacteria bacterium]|nr:hypothetical protein [Deltaproteobacteria bacterium]
MAHNVVLGCTAGSKCSACFTDRSRVERESSRFFAGLTVSLLLVGLAVSLAGCFNGLRLPRPRPGSLEMFEELMVRVPSGRVNAYGGNLFIAREDMSVDTQIGEWTVGAVWNSAVGSWHWNFDTRLKSPRPGVAPIFTDDTGYGFYLKGVSYDKLIQGSHWIRHAAGAIRTSGGLVYHFDPAGELSSVNWISAEYPALHFERAQIRGASRVTSIDQCKAAADCTPLYSMSYDPDGRLISIVDLAGRKTLYTYQGLSQRIASARDALDLANGWPGTRYEYDLEGRLVALTNSHDERVEYRYYGPTQTIMNVMQVGEGDPVWTFAYEGFDLYGFATTTLVDPLGSSSEYRFDIGLRLLRYVNAEGETWRWKWIANTFNRQSEAGPVGVGRVFGLVSENVAWERRRSGNLITRTYAPSPAENREHPHQRAILQIEDRLGLVESRTYSAEGVLESITNGSGDLTTFVFDANGDLEVTDPAGVVTRSADRGSHGHYSSRSRGSKTVNYTFDLVGNLLTVDGLLDQEEEIGSSSIGQGGIVSWSHDADRNTSVVTLEDGGLGSTGLQSELRIEWRADHKRLRIERPYGGDTEFDYDALGRMIEQRTRVDGAWVGNFFEYDALGRASAVLKPNGMATRLSYRSTGEITSVTHERDWTDASEVDGTAEFDYVDGQLIEIRDSAHAMVPQLLFYDRAGRVDEIRFPDGETLTYEYDLRDQTVVKQFRRPDDSLLRSFEYEHDLANRLSSVREDGETILDLTYANGRVEQTRFGNGVEVVNSYDAATGALTGYLASNFAQQLVASMAVSMTTCDLMLPASRCVVEQTDSLIGVIATSYSEYQLEDLGSERLIADSHGSQVPVDVLHGYDELSNITQSALGSFFYNPERNRLLSVEDDGTPVVDYVYDEAGFAIARNGLPIAWNGMGRMVSVANDLVIHWDALGRKVSATVAGKGVRWKYGGELKEDELGADQTLDLGWVVCRLDDSSHEYRLHDFRGNSKLMLNDAGEVTALHHYSGYERVAVDGSDESGSGFAGGTHVDELVLMGARVYDPATRRFLSQDPVFQTINQYSYTLGNPVRFWDPGGDDYWVIKSVTYKGGFVGPLPYLEVSITFERIVGDRPSPEVAPSTPG